MFVYDRQNTAPYCISKCAFHKLYQCLREELIPQRIWVGSCRPGVVDTPMQDHIRSKSREQLPGVDRFISLHANNQLESPERVASFVQWLLLSVESSKFVAEEWDIRNDNPDWIQQ